MEILQIVGFYPPHLGGQEAVVEQLATLQADEHRVTVYTSDIGAAGAPRERQLRGRAGVLRVVRQRAVVILNVPFIPGLLLRLLSHKPRPDIFHVHTGQAFVPEVTAFAAWLRGARFVVHQHLILRSSTRVGQILFPLYQRFVYARVLRRADRVVCLTTAMRGKVIEIFGVDPARAVVIPNGVNTDRFGASQQLRRADELLFVGRLSGQKNVGALLDATAQLRDGGRYPYVRIIGDGKDRAGLQATASRLGLTNIAFEGTRSPAEVAVAYARATAVVMPSTHEGMPLVLLEAMAAGAPVVASALAEMAEVGQDAIVTVDLVVSGALAKALSQVLDDADLRHRLSVAAVARARHYDWAAVVAKVDDLYKEVLGR
jgi:glycosyltransferase involved in cell wall biosynthesis